MLQRTTDAPATSVDLDRLLIVAAALCTGAAGLGHLSAARDHPAHWHLGGFFVVLALAQISWASALFWRPSFSLLRAGLIGNAVVVAIWAVSRTTGLPWIEGATAAEAVGLKDAVTTFLELLAMGAIGLAIVLPEPARRAQLPAAERALPALFAAVLLLSLPATLGSNGHGADHGVHGDAAHVLGATATHEDSAAGHAPTVESHGEVAGHRVEHVAMPELAGHGASAGATHGGAHGAAGATGGDGHGEPGHEDHHEGSAATGMASPPAPVGELATARYGPFSLPPMSTNDVRHDTVILSNTVLTQLPPPCRGCLLTSVDVNLVYEDGRVANYDTGAMLHHHVMFDSSEDDPTCGRFESAVGGMGRRLFAAGNERTSGAFPRGYGLKVDQGDWWTGIFELMNMTEQPQVVFIDVTVRQVPLSDTTVKPVVPIWLDVDNCSDSEIDVPAGRSTTDWDWTSNVTGRIVTAAGHVHDGGVSIALTNATTGAKVCKSVAGYGTKPAYQGHIESMSSCAWDRIGTVREGEVLRISTVYDSPEPLTGVMGILMAFVYETDDLAGGTAAPASITDPPEGGAPPPPASHQH